MRTKLGFKGDLKELEIRFFGVLPIKALPSLALMYRRAFSSREGLEIEGRELGVLERCRERFLLITGMLTSRFWLVFCKNLTAIKVKRDKSNRYCQDKI